MSKNILELIFVAIYFLLVSMIIKALVLNFFPKFFKYFKRGMSKYENVRITTFRALLRFHLDSYVVETLTAAYSIIVLFFIHFLNIFNYDRSLRICYDSKINRVTNINMHL